MDGRHDFIAVDSEFRRFVRERYHNGRAVSDRAMLRRYARWGRWKYLAYWSELWSSVAERLQPLEGEGKSARPRSELRKIDLEALLLDNEVHGT